MKVDIKDKVALVTGANRGIGLAIVESFIAHGAQKVYLAVRNKSNTTELVEMYGDKVVPVQVDVSDEVSVKQLATQVKDVDVVVNNAGTLEVADPLDANFKEKFLKDVNVNVFGLVHMAQAFAPILADKNGAFVQLNSVVSLFTMTPFTSYCASKSATYSITLGLKEVLSEKNVHVLSVHPGATDTQMLRDLGFEGNSEPVETVAEGIVKALQNGDFLLFPGEESHQIGKQYDSFAQTVITSEDA